jgi:hypothetical protein
MPQQLNPVDLDSQCQMQHGGHNGAAVPAALRLAGDQCCAQGGMMHL